MCAATLCAYYRALRSLIKSNVLEIVRCTVLSWLWSTTQLSEEINNVVMSLNIREQAFIIEVRDSIQYSQFIVVDISYANIKLII